MPLFVSTTLKLIEVIVGWCCPSTKCSLQEICLNLEGFLNMLKKAKMQVGKAQEIQRTDWLTAGEQSKLVCGFDKAITGATGHFKKCHNTLCLSSKIFAQALLVFISSWDCCKSQEIIKAMGHISKLFYIILRVVRRVKFGAIVNITSGTYAKYHYRSCYHHDIHHTSIGICTPEDR